jgi:hypothetical protein
MIDLLDVEIRELSQHPQALQLLINYHEYSSSAGDAMGYDVKHHDERLVTLRAAKAAAIAKCESEGREWKEELL